MKILQTVIGILVLIIFGLSAYMIYAMAEYYFYFSGSEAKMYGLAITNEFYILLISTTVLAISSIPTILYQTQKILRKNRSKPNDDELIDDDDLELESETDDNRFLYNSTKFYSFALLTQIILFGKRFNGTYNKLETTNHWLILGGFMLAAFVAIYYLTMDRNTKTNED